MLDAILTEGLRAAEARAGAIGIVTDDGEFIELLAQRGYEGPVMEEWARFPVADDLPMSYVVRTGEPLFLATREERNDLFPNLANQGDGHALAVLPLTLEGRLKGVLGLSFGEHMVFTPERREMKITLARFDAFHLPRIAQLISRSNQFNLTTQRYSEGDCERLMKDENFKALISHPKVQQVFMDPEFQEAIKSQNMGKLATNKKFASLRSDPEIAPLLAKIDPASLAKLMQS